MTFKSLIGIALAACFVAGCSNNPDPIVQNKEAVDNMTLLRKDFTATQGDSTKLSPTDLAAAEKAVGGTQADVQKKFDWMKTSNKTGGK